MTDDAFYLASNLRADITLLESSKKSNFIYNTNTDYLRDKNVKAQLDKALKDLNLKARKIVNAEITKKQKEFDEL